MREQYQSLTSDEFVEWVVTRYELGNTYTPAITVITNGLYAILLRQWTSIFNQDQFYLINGDDLLHNPSTVFTDFENFLQSKFSDLNAYKERYKNSGKPGILELMLKLEI